MVQCKNIKDAAYQYLLDLHKTPSIPLPDSIDEHSSKWADAFVEAIRKYRDSYDSGEARRSARRFGRAATKDKYRFFWECWQNADDARAKKLTFRVNDQTIIVENNGESLSSRDVYSICFIASSQKEGLSDQKGQFGIGFLSMMRISDSPSVHSGYCSFRLDRDYTYPSAIEHEYCSGVRIVAPLRDGIKADDIKAELLKRMEDEVLLYMTHLTCVEVVDERDGYCHRIKCETTSDESGFRQVKIGNQWWHCYHTTVIPGPELSREDGEPVAPKLAIVLARSDSVEGLHRVASYFPTEEYHGLPWRFSAPLEVTNSRESLLDSEYNRWLLQRVGEAMVDAALSDAVGDPVEPWKLVPSLDPDNELLRPLYEAAHSRLRQMKWLPTDSGLCSPDKVAVAASNELRDLVNPSDIPDEAVNHRHWLSGSVNDETLQLLVNLGAYHVGCHELSSAITTVSLRPPDWYLRAVAESIRLCESAGYNSQPVVEQLLNGKCFLDHRGRAFSLADAHASGKVVCSTRSRIRDTEVGRVAESLLVVLHRQYRQPDRKREDPLDSAREEVNRWLQKQSSSRTFRYESRLDPSQFIKHFIVEAEDVEDRDNATHDMLLQFVRSNLDAYVSEYKNNQKLDRIGRNILLEAYTYDEFGKRVRGRLPLSNTYLGSSYTESRWNDVASGVPGIWWLHSKYRKVKKGSDSAGTVSFFRQLGCDDCPRLVRVPEDESHSSYRFSHVTHGNDRDYPNFPHDAVPHYSYTTYGLVDDHVSPDLSSAISHIQSLSRIEREKRGESLLRMLEQRWDKYKAHIYAHAYGYYANGEHPLGRVFCRWLYELRLHPWMLFRDGVFREPADAFASTEAVQAVLGTEDGAVCAWKCNAEEVAANLGLHTQVPADAIIARLRLMQKGNHKPPLIVAKRYYSALAEHTINDQESLAPLKQEELIFCPFAGWRTANQCFISDHRHLFAGLRGYVGVYSDCERLWQFLGVKIDPDLNDLKVYWSEIALEEPEDRILEQLNNTYELADTLSTERTDTDSVPIWTDQGWRYSDQAIAVEDHDLAFAITALPFPRWIHEKPTSLRAFCRWAGITIVDEQAVFGDPDDRGNNSAEDTYRLRTAVSRFANQLASACDNLWKQLAHSVVSWAELEVVQVNHLNVPFRFSLHKSEVAESTVCRKALVIGKRLYVSNMINLRDPEVVVELMRGLGIGRTDSWNVYNALRLALIEALLDGPDARVEPLPYLPEDREAIDPELFNDEETDPRTGMQIVFSNTRNIEQVNVEETQVPEIDDYVVESDTEGDGDVQPGGLIECPPADLRRPGKPASVLFPINRTQRSTRSVEQRGVDLLVSHVLDPDGIKISDQRLVFGVGADLACDDGFFRELKTFSGNAPASIKLTKHEHARASTSSNCYELVIVENVWTTPTITIIHNPLHTMDWHPAGDIEITGWKERLPALRVIKLRKSDDEELPSGENHVDETLNQSPSAICDAAGGNLL